MESQTAVDLVVATAASHLLDRLDDLYDEEPDAFNALIASIDRCMPAISHSTFGDKMLDARAQLLELGASNQTVSDVNRNGATFFESLRLVVGDEYDKGCAHEAIEQNHLDDLERLLSAGWDVDDVATDGMTLLHHAIDVEVDAAAQTGNPLTVEMTKMLIRYGADLTHRWLGKTPQEAAVSRGHTLAVDAIKSTS